MCGIAGIICHNSSSETLAQISRLTDTLRHRGPDDEGVLFFEGNQPRIFGGSDTPPAVYQADFRYTPETPFNNFVPNGASIVLGHRRLSIVDLSPAGHQPMCNEDGTVWIVYNGEIYNFRELCAQLHTRGHRFVSHTDTEVIIHAYEEWGEECLQHFDGMWAFVIYDTKTQTLFAARDRFGVKPLYYHQSWEYVAFASEIKALLLLPFIKKEIGSTAVFDYLFLDIREPVDEGFFRGVSELPAAHALFYDVPDQRLTIRKYYHLAINDSWQPFHPQTSQQHVTTVKEYLFQAIGSRLQSDVPVGTCLSGGIDSSTIVCVINALLAQKPLPQIGEHQMVFTASYDTPGIDESRWAKLVVDNTNTSWFQTFPTAREFIEDLNDLAYTQDIPFGSTSGYAQYRVMRLAGETGVKVLLDGQAGDELFGGYALFYPSFFCEMLKTFSVTDLTRECSHISSAPIHHQQLLFSILVLLGRGLIPARLAVSERLVNPQIAFLRAYCNRDFWERHKQRIEEHKQHTHTSLNAKLQSYMAGPHLKSLLRYEDRNSMRFSLESRTPFADDIQLINTVFQIASAYKIHNGWSKYLLRKAMEGIVPQNILQRSDKIGFVTPEDSW